MLAGRFLCVRHTEVNFSQWYEMSIYFGLSYSTFNVYFAPITTPQTPLLKTFLNAESLSQFAMEPSPEHKSAYKHFANKQYPVQCAIRQTEAKRRRREAEVIQWIEKGFKSCLYVYMFVCFSTIFRYWEHLQNWKWYQIVGYWIIHCLGMLLVQWCSQWERDTWS